MGRSWWSIVRRVESCCLVCIDEEDRCDIDVSRSVEAQGPQSNGKAVAANGGEGA